MPTARLLATCLLAGAVLAGRPVAAQTVTAAPAAEPPRSGPVVRLRAGLAYLSPTVGFNELPDRSYSGTGFGFDAEIGGALSPNVSLGVELSGALAFQASAGNSATVAGGGSPSTDLSTAGIGPSVTYTIHPGNVTLATNPAFTILRSSDPSHFFLAKDWGSNYFGVGIAFLVGGQWPVSRGWRLGAAAEARYAALSGNGDITTLSEYALFFSATHD